MSNEENTKDKTVEELAEALAEAIDEGTPAKEATAVEFNIEDSIAETEVVETVSKEPVTEEELVEEGPAQEEPAKDTTAEEEPTEDKVAEEEPAEEESAEEVPAEEEPTEKKKLSKKAIIIMASVATALVVAILAVYLGMASYYKERFLMGTSVNGTDCSGKTLAEVEAMLQKQVEEYSLTIYEANDASEVIAGTTMDIKYGGYKQLKEAFEKQNPYLWPKALFEKNDVKAEIVFEYNKEKLDILITELECMKVENQVAPVSATVVYNNGEFVIQNEVYGTQIDSAKLSEAIHASVDAMEGTVDLEEAGCYVQPVFTKDSEEVIAAKNEMNKYLTAKITYSLDGIEVVVDKDEIAPWVSVDANMQPVISSTLVKKFTDTLGSKYNTANRSGVITTPTGKQANVAVAGYGRQVGSQAECDQLISEIKAGEVITRSPVISREETPEGEFAWGNTYAEVDITAQHMWYIVNGEVVFETDIVTGKKGQNDTPTGTFTVLEKVPGKYLTGRIVNGKPLYRTWVNYWMRLTWSGIGFHDAGWQPTFGGDRYVNNGSHGCINMPPAKAKEFYSMLSIGTPAVIHY